MQFEPFRDGIEVNGTTVHAVLDGLGPYGSLASKYLLHLGIGVRTPEGRVVIERDAWYPQSAWLKSFSLIAEDIGEAMLEQIGARIPDNAVFPPTAPDLDGGIRSIDVAYHMNHRVDGQVMYDPATGGMLEGIGSYGYQRDSGERRIVSVCRNPYPCSFDLGLIGAVARRFEASAQVTHDPTRPCRRRGAESCTYLITW